jgi:SAM-dependent methyltransferase
VRAHGTSAASSDRPTFAGYYGGFWGGHAFRWIDWRKIALLRRVLLERPHSRRLLDLGCGAAAVSGSLVAGHRRLLVVGVDHDALLLRRASSRGVATVLANLEGPLPFGEHDFDVVLLADTIEHVEEPRAAIRQVLRVLRPDGLLVIFTPPYDSMSWVAAEKLHRAITRRRADHIAPFTRESLSHLLDRHFTSWSVGTLNLGLTLYGLASHPRAVGGSGS